ncbi:hypothetical protein CR513_56091, partial [Mucuna pruriens]
MDSKGSSEVSKGEVSKPKENVGSGSEDKMMKAPGADGSYISRKEFEKNPQESYYYLVVLTVERVNDIYPF